MTFPQLPPATRMILPALAADRGRFRAATLLAILGADPDEVDRDLAPIDAALGSDSPGVDGLAKLVRQTRAASSTVAPTVPRQHVISSGLLRHFTELLNPSGWQLAAVDLRTGETRLTGPRGSGTSLTS